jgi:lactoylglutathione lyase
VRAFPVIFARSVEVSSAFYESLGFERHFRLPTEGEPGYIGLRRDGGEIAVVTRDWPTQQYSAAVGDGVRFEMFVYVEDVDSHVERLREGGSDILSEPDDMPWGERVAYVTDPDGNPVALATAPQTD